MSAGKGSAPRNLGPKFRENYDRIFAPRRKAAKEAEKSATRGTGGTGDLQQSGTVDPHP